MTRKSRQPPPDPTTPRERPGGPTQDELLDEALKETFPASDPTSVYLLELDREALHSSNDYVEKNGLPLAGHRQFK